MCLCLTRELTNFCNFLISSRTFPCFDKQKLPLACCSYCVRILSEYFFLIRLARLSQCFKSKFKTRHKSKAFISLYFARIIKSCIVILLYKMALQEKYFKLSVYVYLMVQWFAHVSEIIEVEGLIPVQIKIFLLILMAHVTGIICKKMIHRHSFICY